MSTVLPPAAALPLELPLLLLLLLLLQPAAAKAIAAKAAIAVVRLIVFLSFIELVPAVAKRTDRPGSGSSPRDNRKVADSTKARYGDRIPPGSRFRPGLWAGRTSPQPPRPAISLPRAEPACTFDRPDRAHKR